MLNSASMMALDPWLRAALVVLGGALYASIPRASTPLAARRLRLALVGVALLACGAYFRFGLAGHAAGFHLGDTYTYVMGSKYFDELAYDGLYDCTVAALEESGRLGDPPPVRDLRALEMLPPGDVMPRAAACRERFAADRWEAFRADLALFDRAAPPGAWRPVLVDQGYNPTPVRTLLGAAAARLPLEGGLGLLIHLDKLLMLLVFFAMGRAFGVEIAALAAIVWGTGELWNYAWIGDSYLRSLWLAATLLGLAALRRERDALGGAWLATAALLRVFPAVFAAAYLVQAVRAGGFRGLGRGPSRRFLLGAAAATLVLVGASTARYGGSAWTGFADKLETFTATQFQNTVGLSVIVRDLRDLVAPRLPEPAPGELAKARIGFYLFLQTVRFGLIAIFLRALWRTLGRVERAEGTALGAAAIPILSAPTNYYTAFVLAGCVVVARRPRVGTALLGAGLAWIALGRIETGFLGASIVLVALSFILVETLRPVA